MRSSNNVVQVGRVAVLSLWGGYKSPPEAALGILIKSIKCHIRTFPSPTCTPSPETRATWALNSVLNLSGAAPAQQPAVEDGHRASQTHRTEPFNLLHPSPSTRPAKPWSALHFGTQHSTAQPSPAQHSTSTGQDRRKGKGSTTYWSPALRDNRSQSLTARQPGAPHIRLPPPPSQLLGPLRALALRGVRKRVSANFHSLSHPQGSLPSLHRGTLRLQGTPKFDILLLNYIASLPSIHPSSLPWLLYRYSLLPSPEGVVQNKQSTGQTCDCEPSRLRTPVDSLGTTFVFAWLGGVLRKAKDSQTP